MRSAGESLHYIQLGKFDEALEFLRELDATGYRSLLAGGMGIRQLETLVKGAIRG